MKPTEVTVPHQPRVERLLHALEFVREHVTDDNRRVLNATSITETADGVRIIGADDSVEPCRACLLGWAGFVEWKFDLFDHDIDGGSGPVFPVQSLIGRACDALDLEPGPDDGGCSATRATREGPTTLNAVIDKARDLACADTISRPGASCAASEEKAA